MAYGSVNVDKMTTSDGISSAGVYGFKNRLINGACVIDQRNAGASVTNAAATAAFSLDRWKYYGTSASKFTIQQNAGSVTPPVGFANYLGITSLSANTPAVTDEYILTQNIEGYNIADLAWGTASAKSITISFQVYSSLTGTFSGALGNSANTRIYPFTYTISSANTWTTASITIAGDTSGTWLTTNGVGIRVNFNLGTGSTYLGTAGAWSGTFANGATGSVNILGTNGATFYITGTQLEVGSTATSFDYRPYTTELQLCQRYYQQIGKNPNTSYQGYGMGVAVSTTTVAVIVPLVVTMRASPSFTFNGATNTIATGGGSVTAVSSDINTPFNVMYQVIASPVVVNSGSRHFQNAGNASSLELSAEL